MTSKRRSLLLLLGSLEDLLPTLRGSLRTDRGLAPVAVVACPDCSPETPGYRLDRFKRPVPCVTCGGRIAGEGVRAKRGRGTVKVDPMDSERQVIRTASSDVPTRPAHTVPCDACDSKGVGKPHLRDLDDPSSEYRDPCERCGGSGRRVVAKFDLAAATRERSDDPVVDMIEDRKDAGDYAAVERELAKLPKRARSLILSVHGPTQTREPHSLTQTEETSLELALGLIEAGLPDTLKVPGWARSNARNAAEHRLRVKATRGKAAAVRDKEIRALIRRGVPTQRVAFDYGLSVSRVNRIFNGESEEAA